MDCRDCRKSLVDTAEAVVAARREYRTQRDAAVLEHLASPSSEDERRVQTLGAIDRQLTDALQQLEAAVASLDQLARIEAEAAA